jgi:hypothetical protein
MSRLEVFIKSQVIFKLSDKQSSNNLTVKLILFQQNILKLI